MSAICRAIRWSPRGYRSIGCWPCTRAVAPGEPIRRRTGLDPAKSECASTTCDPRRGDLTSLACRLAGGRFLKPLRLRPFDLSGHLDIENWSAVAADHLNTHGQSLAALQWSAAATCPVVRSG